MADGGGTVEQGLAMMTVLQSSARAAPARGDADHRHENLNTRECV
jgi:hypothetical protein